MAGPMHSLDAPLLGGGSRGSFAFARTLIWPKYLLRLAAGGLIIGLTAWGADRAYRTRATEARGPFVPRQGIEEVLVRPAAGAWPLYGAGMSALMPSLTGPKCLFIYGDLLNEQGPHSFLSPRFTEGCKWEEAWLYGAHWTRGALAQPTGHTGDVLKGRLMCWPSLSFAAKLRAADLELNYNPRAEASTNVRRTVAPVVKKDGTSAQAYWYYQTQPSGVAPVADAPLLKLLIFGCGYSATRLANSLVQDGWQVVCTHRERVDENFVSYKFSRDSPLPPTAFEGVTHVLDSIPPDEKGQPSVDMHGKDLAALDSLVWVGYLSTTGVYGDHGGAWVDENSVTKPTNTRSVWRLNAEKSWLNWARQSGKHTQIFRLSGIYGPGPGKSQLSRLASGQITERVIKEGHTTGRIHVDDIVNIVRAGMTRPREGPIFNVADDYPSSGAEVIEEAAKILSKPVPPAIRFEDAVMSPMAASFYVDNRKVDNRRIKDQLDVQLLYPTYREGLRAIFEDGQY
eukprot:g64364.t1